MDMDGKRPTEMSDYQMNKQSFENSNINSLVGSKKSKMVSNQTKISSNSGTQMLKSKIRVSSELGLYKGPSG